MGEKKKIAIIGGSGKMGRWFAQFLRKEGHEVIITGRNEKKLLEAKRQIGVEIASNEEAVGWADAVVLSVPIDSFAEVVEQIAPYTRPEQLIFDVTSVKVLPVEAMHQHIKKGLVLGTHPVFGPGARSLASHNFVLTPTDEKETALAQKVRQYLETKGAKVAIMTPQEHDEMMSVILGLSHFIAIASADTLLSFDKLEQMKAIGGITYKALLTLVESVLSEDPELYASIQMNLPRVVEAEGLFQSKVKAWSERVKNRDRHEFIQRMTALREKLEKSSPDFGKAYENMYKLADRL